MTIHVKDHYLISWAREILSDDNGRFLISSSIFSQYLITNITEADTILKMLITMYKHSAEKNPLKRFREQRRSLISRSNLQLIFSGGNGNCADEQRIFKYFDSIKNLPTATDNPYFWFQFAITALNLPNYELAGTYFENAYANADQMSFFDTYQMDTHKARYLLTVEMRQNNNRPDLAYDTFKQAHQLLKNSKDKGQKITYVLGQMTVYEEYFRTFRPILSEEQYQHMMEYAIEIKERFITYFRLPELREIPGEMINAYRKYRRIFENTPYIIMLKQSDELFNTKVPEKRKIR